MPILRIDLNRQVDSEVAQRVIKSARTAIHEVKGDAEAMISVSIDGSSLSEIGYSHGQPIANLQLISFNMNAVVTSELTKRFTALLWNELRIAADRTYIVFQNVPESYMTSWGGRTFSEIAMPQGGRSYDLPRQVRGRITGRTPNADGSTGLSNLKLELWEVNPPRGAGSADLASPSPRFLSSGLTDSRGYFNLPFARDAEPSQPPAVLSLRIFEPDQVLSSSAGVRRYIAAEQPVHLSLSQPPAADDGDPEVTVGAISLEYYEYDNSWPFAYVVPSSMRFGFSELQESRYREAEEISTRKGLQLVGRLNGNPEGLSVDDIQSAFPKNQTILMEAQAPGSSRSDDFFSDRLLNCFVPPLYRKCQEDPTLLKLEYNWKSFERRPELTLLSFRARFLENGGKLVPVDIGIGHNNEDDPTKFTVYTPKDGQNWLYAKRLVRAHHHNVVAQFQGHLAIIHFALEQYAIAFMRTVRLNPVRQLLFPFLREVMAINEKGRSTLVGGQDITGVIEPIAQASLRAWIGDSIGRQDWSQWSPRTPICAAHKYAHSANAYWRMVQDVVEEHFVKYASGIQAHWAEVLAFSQTLVKHAVPYVLDGMEEKGITGKWYCTKEISPARTAGDKALSSITQVASNPPAADVTNLKQLCSYVIFRSTFAHSWVHAFMSTDLGELRYSGMVRGGGFGPESDDKLIAIPMQAMYALGSTATLSQMNCGFMLLNEGGDAPQRLIDKVRAAEVDFKNWGFDVSLLCSRLNT